MFPACTRDTDWIFLQANKYIASAEFKDLSCPLPESVCDIISFEDELNIKVLLKSKNSSNRPYAILKAKVDSFIQNHLHIIEKSISLSPFIDLDTDVTVASSTNTNLVDKNEKLIAFLSIIF